MDRQISVEDSGADLSQRLAISLRDIKHMDRSETDHPSLLLLRTVGGFDLAGNRGKNRQTFLASSHLASQLLPGPVASHPVRREPPDGRRRPDEPGIGERVVVETGRHRQGLAPILGSDQHLKRLT